MLISGEITVIVDAVDYEQIQLEKPDLCKGFAPGIIAMIAARNNEHFKSIERICQKLQQDTIVKSIINRAATPDIFQVTFETYPASKENAG